MLTINTLLEELKEVPADRFEDLYAIIHSLSADTRKENEASKQILSFAGSFKDMKEDDYKDFILHAQQVRTELFDRAIDL